MKLVKPNINIYFKSDFVKNVLVLLTGTGIGQLIPILLSPILTRIYTPVDFGVFGLYLAYASVLSVFANGRYDFSIIEPKFEKTAKILMYISIYLTIIFSFFLLILIIILPFIGVKIIDFLKIGKWSYFLPVSVFSISMNSIFSFWLNRKKMYRAMSLNRVINSGFISGISFFLGANKFLTGGLIIGHICGQFFAVMLLKNKILTFSRFKNIKISKMKSIMYSYIQYPKFLLPATLASEISINVPIILITTLFSSSITGFFSFATRIVSLPISFIGNAIGEVYRQEASEEYIINGNCKKLYLKTLYKLFYVSIIPFFVLFSFGEFLFGFLFGPNWTEAGKIAEYLSFLIFFQFLSTPMAFTIVFNKSQKSDMILQFFRAIFSILSILIGYKMNDYLLSVLLYTIVFSTYYFLHSILQYRAAIGLKSIF